MARGTVLARRPHWHAPEKGTGPAFALSLLAHALLFLSIAFVVRWKTEPMGTVTAELWGGLPAPAPAPVVPVPPRPEPKVEPTPEPPPRKADIVLEPKKIEPPKKVEPPKVEPKIEPPKKVEPLKKAEPPKAEPKVDREAEKRRQEELQRIAAAAGSPSPSGGAATGAAGGMSASYRGQVIGCIRPNIVFSVPENVQPKQYVAEFEVQLLPTGEQAGAPKLLKPSGLPAYDQAVERAIRRCDPFPRPKEGALPRTVRLTFDPVDTR
jgi:colicin import membrane protein